MKKPSNCLVCNGLEANYKFRCCRRSFCSQDCFKSHVDCDSLIIPKPFVPERRFIRSDNLDLNLPDEEIVSEEMLMKVAANPEIKSLLQDPLLHRILVRLDNTRDRRHIFSKLYETSPVFFQLVEKLAEVIGVEDTAIVN